MGETGEASPRWAAGSTARVIHAGLVALAFCGTLALGFGLIFPAFGVGRRGAFGGSGGAIAGAAVICAIQLIVVIWGLVLKLGRLRLVDVGWHFRDLRGDLVRGAVGAVAMVAAFVGVMAAFGVLDASELLATVRGYSAGQRVQWVVIGATAAFAEETIARGYLQSALVQRIGTVPGVLTAALVFALWHVPLSPHLLGLSFKFLSGIILGTLRGKDRSLIGPAIAHFAFWQVVGSG